MLFSFHFSVYINRGLNFPSVSPVTDQMENPNYSGEDATGEPLETGATDPTTMRTDPYAAAAAAAESSAAGSDTEAAVGTKPTDFESSETTTLHPHHFDSTSTIVTTTVPVSLPDLLEDVESIEEYGGDATVDDDTNEEGHEMLSLIHI